MAGTAGRNKVTRLHWHFFAPHLMTDAVSTLVCFAVKEEAAPFKQLAGGQPGLEILVTGMGRRNAEKAVNDAFAKSLPKRVITAGFAGGLVPDLAKSTVVFCADAELGLEPFLVAASARPVRFHCADRVLTTAAQKRALHESTGAEAVEMESGFIQSLCRKHRVPVAIVRVILDTVSEDLALDFNQLMTADQRIDAAKLAWVLLKSPSKIPQLMGLQKQSAAAARLLGNVLDFVLFPAPPV
jgi:nucleoside phosphorylase